MNLMIRRSLSLCSLQMIAHTAQCDDFDVGANALQLLAQKAYIDLYMVFYGIGVVTPDTGENGFLGKVAFACLHEPAHYVKFTRGQTHFAIIANEHGGGQVQRGVAIGDHIHMTALSAQQCVDACQQLAGIEGLGETVIRTDVECCNALFHIGVGNEH